MTSDPQPTAPATCELFWLPLGAGAQHPSIRRSGRLFEALVARHNHRIPKALYHSALEVGVDGQSYVIEMAPVWNSKAPQEAVALQGPVGAKWLGHSQYFRYQVHCWRDGQIPDRDEAVASPQHVKTDSDRVGQLLELLPSFPDATWGRDELRAGEMWNSNSLTSWLLERSGHDTNSLIPPPGGRAPGWDAGIIVARRCETRPSRHSSSPSVPSSEADGAQTTPAAFGPAR